MARAGARLATASEVLGGGIQVAEAKSVGEVGATPEPTRERIGLIAIHGVGDADAGWTNDNLIRRLTAHPASPAFEEHSEVYDLPDRGRNRSGLLFKSYLRRGRTRSGHDISILEMTWADLSSIGKGTIADALLMLKLFYEAPQVLAERFFGSNKNGLVRAIELLVRLANWILRWPITGLNIVAFVCAMALLMRQSMIETPDLHPFLAFDLSTVMVGLLVVLVGLSLLFARWRVYRDIALTDIGMSTMMCAGASAAAIALAGHFLPAAALSNPASYLQGASIIIFGFWLIWNYAILAAILILGALAVQQAIGGRTVTRTPVIRPAAAVSLSVAQGVIYKIVIALLWIFIFVTLDFNNRTQSACQNDPFQACAYLADLQKNLVGIVVFNLIVLSALVVTFFGIAMTRAFLRTLARRARSLASFWMPRMIVSPVAIFVLLTGTLFNLIIFYWRVYIPVDFYKQVDVRLLDWQEVVKVMITGGSALSVAFYAFRALQHAARGIVHIGRDIVDHQFKPRFTLSRYLLPRPAHKNVAHPRRARIEARLDVILKELAVRERFDRLVFVAHSQGSVILHDYLREHRDIPALNAARRIDVLTLGSPISHIYQYYFARYDDESAGPEALNTRITTWTNMWRVDDPIGNRINLFGGTVIRNFPLRPGGHVDYWRDPEVQYAIIDLIEERPIGTGYAAVAVPACSENEPPVALVQSQTAALRVPGTTGA